MEGICSTFILLIERSYQFQLLWINMIDIDLCDLLLLIDNGNATVISNGRNNQPCNLAQRNLLVEGRGKQITYRLKHAPPFLCPLAFGDIPRYFRRAGNVPLTIFAKSLCASSACLRSVIS